MKIDNNNGCVYILSGRPNMILECVERFYDFYNKKYDFPLYIYYFDDIYNKKNQLIANKLIKKYKIKFKKIENLIPKHINYDDLYFNKNYPYVKRSFGSERINFLHMNHFLTNQDNRPELNKYRFQHRIDDDVFVNKNIDENLFEIMYSQNFQLASSKLWNHYTANTRDTRREFFNFYKNFLKESKTIPCNNKLNESIKNNNEKLFHELYWSAGHFNLYDQKYLKNHKQWKSFINAINSHGGIYKYRWGDLEIIGLFLYTYFKNPKLDLGLARKGIIKNDAKGAKVIHNDSKLNFYLKKIYRKARYQFFS